MFCVCVFMGNLLKLPPDKHWGNNLKSLSGQTVGIQRIPNILRPGHRLYATAEHIPQLLPELHLPDNRVNRANIHDRNLPKTKGIRCRRSKKKSNIIITKFLMIFIDSKYKMFSLECLMITIFNNNVQ